MERKVENLGIEAAMNKLLARFPRSNFVDVWACWEDGVLKFTTRVGDSCSNQESGWGSSADEAVEAIIVSLADWSAFELAGEIKRRRAHLETLENLLAGKDPMQVAMAKVQLEEKEVDRVAC